jgi:hypothetical protein
MITKKKLRALLNVIGLIITAASIVVAAVYVQTAEGKAAAVAAFLIALRTKLPFIKGQVDKAIDDSSLPEEEK